MKFLNNIDLGNNQLLNGLLQNLGADPTPTGGTLKGLVWFNTAAGVNLAKVWNGSSADTITNLLESVAGSGAISVSAIAGKSQTISIAAASGAVPGTMSAADYTLLHTATATNTASAIVQRDASGNFIAGTITAALTGTASNASNLNNQAPSYYLARANQTGTQTASTISDLAATVQAYTLNQFAAPTAPLAMGGQRITGVADPTAATDAATKNYVDSVASGLDVKASVRLASTGNVTVTYTATGGTSGRGQITAAPNAIDGVSLAAGNRILLKNQTTGAQNGIYTVTTVGTGANGVWDRATDFDTDPEVTSGAFTFIEEGTQAGTGWVLNTPNPITIGGAAGTSLSFQQFSSSASYTAGNGLQLVGSQFSAVGTTNRIAVSGAGIDIAATYVGQTSITTLGTIATGTWQGTTVAVAYGGTGATTVAAAKTNLGFMGRYATDIGDGASTTITVTHNLGTLDVVVAMFQKSDGSEVYANVVHATTNTITVAFSVAPASTALRCVVMG